MNTQLSLLGREITLNRYSIRNKETLQAWDAADEMLIKHRSEQILDKKDRLLIIGDHFGALTTWFAPHSRVTMISDSYIAQQATVQNLEANQLQPVSLQDALQTLPHAEHCIMRLPKNKRLLVWHLIQLCQQMPEGMTIVTAAKAKDIHTSTLKLFEKYLGTNQDITGREKSAPYLYPGG